MQSRLARPVLNISKRTAVLPASASAFARPDIVDIETYVYPGNPSYAGQGPRAIPEEWVRDDKVVHYMIPKTFVDWITPKLGETGIYSLMVMGGLALASKEYLVIHTETRIALNFFVCWALINMAAGDMVRDMAADQFTASYDRLYAVKEHDVEGNLPVG